MRNLPKDITAVYFDAENTRARWLIGWLTRGTVTASQDTESLPCLEHFAKGRTWLVVHSSDGLVYRNLLALAILRARLGMGSWLLKEVFTHSLRLRLLSCLAAGFAGRDFREAAKPRREPAGLSDKATKQRAQMHESPTYGVGLWLFVRALALILLASFLSAVWEMPALAGTEGILPAEQSWGRNLPESWQAGIAGLRPDDTGLVTVSLLGILGSVLLFLDLAPRYASLACWLCYLVLTNAAHDFFQFTTDALLTESTLLVAILLPGRLGWRGRGPDRPPSPLALWLLWFLLFRLFLSTGVMKLWGGEAHRDGTGFELILINQTALGAWMLNHLHDALKSIAHIVLISSHFVVPLLMLTSSLRRASGTVVMAYGLFMFCVTGGGAYHFIIFVLGFTLIDDRRWRQILRLAPGERRWCLPWIATESPRPNLTRALILLPLFVLVSFFYVMAVARFSSYYSLQGTWLHRISVFQETHFRFVAAYHEDVWLDRRRYELVIEASHDGKTWEEYVFKGRPGPPEKMPPFAVLVRPRLAVLFNFTLLPERPSQNFLQALRAKEAPDETVLKDVLTFPPSFWLRQLLAKLGKNHPAATAFLDVNPFADKPPRFMRARVYRYRFGKIKDLYFNGVWWHRYPVTSMPLPYELSHPHADS